MIFNPVAEYVLGKKLVTPDVRSRHPETKVDNTLDSKQIKAATPSSLSDTPLGLVGHNMRKKCCQISFGLFHSKPNSEILETISKGSVNDKVLSCTHSNNHTPSQLREPLITMTLPELPWQKKKSNQCRSSQI